MKQFLDSTTPKMSGIASLSTGVLPRIVSGEEVNCPVLQILGTKLYPAGDGVCVRLLLSDGVYSNSIAVLATIQDSMFEGLKTNTIVRIDKYMMHLVKRNGTESSLLIILEMTVLNNGDQVQMIGKPVSFIDDRDKVAPPGAVTPPVTSNLSPSQYKWVYKVRVISRNPIATWSNTKNTGKLCNTDSMGVWASAFKEHCDKYYNIIEVKKVPIIAPLSVGAIPRVMSGEKVDCPVFQILGVKRVTVVYSERLRLLLSDSVYCNSFVILGKYLNSKFNEDNLKKNTIVRIDRYKMSLADNNDNGKNVLVILEWTILNTSDQVKKIGEPVSYYTKASN